MKPKTILQLNSSSRYQDSITRKLSDALVKQLSQDEPELKVITRDLATGLPFVDEQWIAANFTDPEERTPHHEKTLSFSTQLVEELQQAEYIVIGSPIYNFNIPAALKAWIDLVVRAKLTFHYTENGPEGLLKNKQVMVAMASGGVPIGSEADLASLYLKQVLSFIGLTDVTFVDASKVGPD